MRIRDLREAPINDLEFVGDIDLSQPYNDRSPGAVMPNKLSKADVGPAMSTKGRAKIFQMFEKTPFTFNFYILANPETAKSIGRFQDSHMQIPVDTFEKVVGKKHDPNSITFVVTNNVTNQGNYVPLTGWILAHRLGHGAQIGKHPLWNKTEMYFYNYLGRLLGPTREQSLAFPRVRTRPYRSFVDPVGDKQLMSLWVDIGTMRSARNKNTSSSLDIFPEIFAQYLLTGKVTFKPLDAHNHGLVNDVKTTNEKIMKLEDTINGMFPRILESMVGGIWRLF